jgi:hypothetical protein
MRRDRVRQVRWVQGPPIAQKRPVSPHNCSPCFVLIAHPRFQRCAPHSSYVAAFILSTSCIKDSSCSYALWVGYETEPGVVVWPKQHGHPPDKNEYYADSEETEAYYTQSMLRLHKKVALAGWGGLCVVDATSSRCLPPDFHRLARPLQPVGGGCSRCSRFLCSL